MKSHRARLTEMSLNALALVLSFTGLGGGSLQAQVSGGAGENETYGANTTGFYCNTGALNPVERASHRQLTEKLTATRAKIVEMTNGYEFQFRPAQVSLEELAQWVKAEAKCCPFFDFHIDLEEKGTLLCLRLTGQAGIKAFIRSEFEVR